MQFINLSHSETPHGHRHRYIEKSESGKVTLGSYQYYESSNLSKTAGALTGKAGFIIDHVQSDCVRLVNHLTKEVARLWTSTGEVEIECSVGLKV